jgi:hypothetical protein
MRRTFVYFISLLLSSLSSLLNGNAQDTIQIPLKIKAGIEVSGPVIHYLDKNILNSEAFVGIDLNEKITAVLAGGYQNYSYTQFNYSYHTKGTFVRTGLDFNLLKPDKSKGKYWAGIGLRYGLSVFTSETPSFQQENYWGLTTSSIAQETRWAHFVEVSPGVRTEIFRNFTMGWTISLRMMVYNGAGKDIRSIYVPGFGNAANSVSAGIGYFFVWNIPYKKITVILKKEEPEELDDTGNTINQGQQTIRP